MRPGERWTLDGTIRHNPRVVTDGGHSFLCAVGRLAQRIQGTSPLPEAWRCVCGRFCATAGYSAGTLDYCPHAPTGLGANAPRGFRKRGTLSAKKSWISKPALLRYNSSDLSFPFPFEI